MKKTEKKTSAIHLDDLLAERARVFVLEIANLVRADTLERLRQSFVSGIAGELAPSPPTKTARKAPTPAPEWKPIKYEKRKPEALERLRLRFVEHVKKNPGQRIEEIAKILRLRGIDLQLPVRKALDVGEIKKTGERRATRYYPK